MTGALLARTAAAAALAIQSKTGGTTYTAAAYQLGDVLVFGSESQGLPPSLL